MTRPRTLVVSATGDVTRESTGKRRWDGERVWSQQNGDGGRRKEGEKRMEGTCFCETGYPRTRRTPIEEGRTWNVWRKRKMVGEEGGGKRERERKRIVSEEKERRKERVAVRFEAVLALLPARTAKHQPRTERLHLRREDEDEHSDRSGDEEDEQRLPLRGRRASGGEGVYSWFGRMEIWDCSISGCAPWPRRCSVIADVWTSSPLSLFVSTSLRAIFPFVTCSERSFASFPFFFVD